MAITHHRVPIKLGQRLLVVALEAEFHRPDLKGTSSSASSGAVVLGRTPCTGFGPPKSDAARCSREPTPASFFNEIHLTLMRVLFWYVSSPVSRLISLPSISSPACANVSGVLSTEGSMPSVSKSRFARSAFFSVNQIV